MKKLLTILLAVCLLSSCESNNKAETTTTVTAASPEYEVSEQEGSRILQITEIREDAFICCKTSDETVIYTVQCDTSLYGDYCVGDIVDISYAPLYKVSDTEYIAVLQAIKAPETYAAMKPVIYLYPEEKTEVSVELDYNGELTVTYPEYNNGWTVTAEPDGTLFDSDGLEYSYLFWEGESDTVYDFSEGFCVKGEDTAEFLRSSLSALGLTPREYNEFIVFWLPLMKENEYNVISFQGSCYTDNAELTVTPAPDTVLRVFMAYYPSESYVDIPPQELNFTERKGFTLVEWGGSLQN